MILRSFHGLRFEALSPARYVFLLEEDSDPLYLIFDGVYWQLRYRDEPTECRFVSRANATLWLRQQIDEAEERHHLQFDFAHYGESNE